MASKGSEGSVEAVNSADVKAGSGKGLEQVRKTVLKGIGAQCLFNGGSGGWNGVEDGVFLVFKG